MVAFNPILLATEYDAASVISVREPDATENVPTPFITTARSEVEFPKKKLN